MSDRFSMQTKRDDRFRLASYDDQDAQEVTFEALALAVRDLIAKDPAFADKVAKSLQSSEAQSTLLERFQSVVESLAGGVSDVIKPNPLKNRPTTLKDPWFKVGGYLNREIDKVHKLHFCEHD